MKKLLFNASNLHTGGGIQVATSIVFELLRTIKPHDPIEILISSEIEKELNNIEKNLPKNNFKILNTYSSSIFNLNFSFNFNSQQTVLTVFGPLYRWRTPFINIVGFAQAWIIYPNNECYSMLSTAQRIKTRLKYWIQGLFFKRADILVVELEHVKQGLIRELNIPEERIHVVHNCLSSIYLNESLWQQVEIPKSKEFLNLGFLGRNYIHKNTSIFPAITAELEKSHGLKARFYVTFTEQEWVDCTPEFRAVCINAGPLALTQCPHFYQILDAVVFPSLLECFSATPLEAMAMKKPLFASDRPFNHDICGPHAHYFDPLNPTSAARVIAYVLKGNGPDPVALKAAREHAINFSSPKERAEKYLALLMGDEYIQSTSK